MGSWNLIFYFELHSNLIVYYYLLPYFIARVTPTLAIASVPVGSCVPWKHPVLCVSVCVCVCYTCVSFLVGILPYFVALQHATTSPYFLPHPRTGLVSFGWRMTLETEVLGAFIGTGVTWLPGQKVVFNE